MKHQEAIKIILEVCKPKNNDIDCGNCFYRINCGGCKLDKKYGKKILLI